VQVDESFYQRLPGQFHWQISRIHLPVCFVLPGAEIHIRPKEILLSWACQLQLSLLQLPDYHWGKFSLSTKLKDYRESRELLTDQQAKMGPWLHHLQRFLIGWKRWLLPEAEHRSHSPRREQRRAERVTNVATSWVLLLCCGRQVACVGGGDYGKKEVVHCRCFSAS
jgi:hypothetical protein